VPSTNDTGSALSGRGKRERGKPSNFRFRPNPVRQTILVALALAGIGIGYGLGFVFKKPTPPQPVTASQTSVEPTAPAAPETPPAPTAQPEPAAPEPEREQIDAKRRAYEESLPDEIAETVESEAASPKPVEAMTAEAEPETKSDSAPQANLEPEAVAEPKAEDQPQPPTVAVVPPALPPVTASSPRWRRNAVAIALTGQPRIAIIIDDVGVDRARSKRAIKLPPPLTLSFLAYADQLAAQTSSARAEGHELMLHLPMEPGSVNIDPGPNVLLSGVPEAELMASLSWNLDQFDGYIGVNNHMGSRFTADLAGMTVVMHELSKRELIFLDSLTTNNSTGRRAARQAGVPFLARNVFLDHVDELDAIKARLDEVERLAKRQGFAIAIGHPHDATLEALAPWLASVQSRGFQLVPLSALVRLDDGEG